LSVTQKHIDKAIQIMNTLSTPTTAQTAHRSSTAFLLAFVGVLIFSFTLPLSKYAIAHGMSAPFIAFGRAVLAGVVALIYLIAKGEKLPPRDTWRDIFLSSLGVVIGFPLFSSLALQTVPSSHAIVFNGLLPLATAVGASFLFHKKQSPAFWLIAILGALVIIAYNMHHVGFDASQLEWADGWMLLAVAICAMGYNYGAKVSGQMSSVLSICWALVFALPLTTILALMIGVQTTSWPTDGVTWGVFVYLALMSQFIGFFFWYGGLTMGGAAKVSQVQLAQTLLSLIWATVLFNEPSTLAMWLTVAVTIVLIALSKRVG
jgi:drug/metabolite transporter (DMT)-like permease